MKNIVSLLGDGVTCQVLRLLLEHHVKILKVRQFVRLFAERLDAEKIF